MILLFTDYSVSDPYCGLMKAAIWENAPGAVIVDVLHHAPDFNIQASSHLLAAVSAGFPVGSVCLAVIDPGVGSDRAAVVLLADEKWYVGPDNGLLSVVAGRAKQVELWEIDWRPQCLSASFHGRDVFAPIAASIEKGSIPYAKLTNNAHLKINKGCGDLAEVIYVDHYGNVVTGVRAAEISRAVQFMVGTSLIRFARVFSEAVPGSPFWYENSLGLVEFALNGASAAQFLGARVGDQFEMRLPT